MNGFKVLYGLVLVVVLFCCSPQVTSTTDGNGTNVSVTTSDPVSAGPCGTFDESANPDAAIEAHVLYRDFIKAKDFESAFPYWEKAYSMAPAADGKRSTHYLDGVAIYENKISTEKDSAKIRAYIDQIFELYDEMDECYGGDGYIDGLRGFDLYYNYKGLASNDEIWGYFRNSMDTDGDTANVFIINPMSDLLVKRYFNEEIDQATAQAYANKILARIEKARKDDKNREQWDIVDEYAPQRLDIFEGVKGFFDCQYFRAKYYESLDEIPTDCDQLREVYSKLKWGGCAEDDEAFKVLGDALKANCKELIKTSGSGAYQALQNGSYDEAIKLFTEAAEKASDIEKKSRYELLIAKIYYAHLKRFPDARTWALKAAETRSGWGDPYMLIGRMYASSGPLCGPGRGWDSQIVTWPAIDMWQRAKSVDPSVTGEANKWINRYAQYMPTVEDGFQRGISEGQSFYVGCWIKESTKVRFAK